MSAKANFWIRWRVRVGYPAALIYLALAHPRPLLIGIGGGIGVIGLAIRAWAAGHLRKHQALAVAGPYAFTRNPLYFGSVILAAGFIVAGGSVWSGIVIAAYIGLFYPAVMRREEGELKVRYGECYARYAAAVPLFWPALLRFHPDWGIDEPFSAHLYRRNREYQAVIGFAIGLALLWLRMLWPS